MLPVLHLNGYKIANPTVLARIPEDELRSLFEGYGYAPRFVEGDDPRRCTGARRGRSTPPSTTSPPSSARARAGDRRARAGR